MDSLAVYEMSSEIAPFLLCLLAATADLRDMEQDGVSSERIREETVRGAKSVRVFSFLITDHSLAWTLRLVDKERVGPIRVPLISKVHFVATLTMSTGKLRAMLFSYLALRPPSTAVNAK
ncbi:hypothetical protein MHYP_G00072910 [Metynnis hypsauchen]